MGEVVLSIEGSVAMLTISSPEVRNALGVEMCRELAEHCDTIDADGSIGAVVIRGDQGTFCSGADTRGWGLGGDPASDAAFVRSELIYSSFVRVGELKAPSVAAARGSVVGAGMNLYLATDLRIVATDARLMAGFLRAGIHPGGGFFTLMGRLAGREAAAALGLFSEEVSGATAVNIGLAWEAVPDEKVETRALELAEVVSRDPELGRRVVASLRSELGPPPVSWQAALEMERGKQMWSQRRRQMKLEES